MSTSILLPDRFLIRHSSHVYSYPTIPRQLFLVSFLRYFCNILPTCLLRKRVQWSVESLWSSTLTWFIPDILRSLPSNFCSNSSKILFTLYFVPFYIWSIPGSFINVTSKIERFFALTSWNTFHIKLILSSHNFCLGCLFIPYWIKSKSFLPRSMNLQVFHSYCYRVESIFRLYQLHSNTHVFSRFLIF